MISQGTISFFPGAAVGSTACFTVDIIDDQQVEPDETFQLFLTRENEILDELPVTILGGRFHGRRYGTLDIKLAEV